MDTWNILGLEKPTNNKKDIKRAYAKKLRVNKPDEKPEAFQQLHEAYKHALILAEEVEQNNNETGINTNVPMDTDRHIDTHHKDTQIFSDNEENPRPDLTLQPSPQTTTTTEVSSNPFKKHNEEIQQALSETTAIIDTSLKTREQVNDISHWDFLPNNTFIFDDSFNSPLGIILFSKISQFNLAQFQTKDPQNHHIKPDILEHFDAIFDWRSHEEYYYSNYDEQQCDAIFKLLDYSERNMDLTRVTKSAGITQANPSLKINTLGKTFFVASGFIFIAFIIAMALTNGSAT